MTLLHARHQALVAHVPHGARRRRVSAVTVSTPVEIPELDPGDVEDVGLSRPAGISLAVRGDVLWARPLSGEGPVGIHDLAAWLALWPRRFRLEDPLTRAFAHSPFERVAAPTVTALPMAGLDGTRVVEDWGGSASRDAAAWAAANLATCRGEVMVRSRGPLVRFAAGIPKVMLWPQQDWGAGQACRPDRAGELWDFRGRAAGTASGSAMPAAMPGWVANFPCGLLGDGDAVLYANKLAVWTDAIAEEYGRRLSVPGFRAATREARAGIEDLVRAGMFGLLDRAEAAEALRRCSSVLRMVGRVWRERRDAGRIEGWERSLNGIVALNHVAWAERHVIPRLDPEARPEGDDADALAGL